MPNSFTAKAVRSPGDEYEPGAERRIAGGLTFIPAVGGVYAQGPVTHGLGFPPTCVVATSEDGESYATVQARTTTTFTCTLKKTNGATHAGANVHWLAWG